MAEGVGSSASPEEPGTSGVAADIAQHEFEIGEDTSVEILPAAGPLRHVLRGMSLVEQAIGVVLLLVILILVLVQVGQRYVPGTGLPATGEVARLAMVWATFLLSGYLMAHDRHIAIHVVDYFLPTRALGVVKLVGHFLVAFTCGVMAYATWNLIAGERGQVTPEAGIPLTVVYSVALLGFALTAVRAVVSMFILDLPALARARDEDA